MEDHCGDAASDAAIDEAVMAARVDLGRVLFYDPILSSDGQTACATCHSEHWGMGDGLPLAIGVGGGTLSGPGRSGENVARRNAPSLWNMASRGALFWDGRASSLEAQALLPLEMPDELGLPVDEALGALADVPECAARFALAFPDAEQALDADHLAQALATFERTLVSEQAPYDAFMAGDSGALSVSTQQGLALFAELECDGCHTPPVFARDVYANRGIGSAEDLGRFEISDASSDRGAFRVPSLRNARVTAPYFHDGSVQTLREAVQHEARQQALAGMRELDDAELDALTELLQKALLDISNNPDRPERVPSGLPIPRDGFRIPR